MGNKSTVKGHVQELSEMGGRGTPVWAIEGDESSFYIQSGDVLTVFNDSSKKDIVWSGEVDLVKTELPYPEPNTRQNGMSLEEWRDMFSQKYPAELKTQAPKKIIHF